MTILSPLPLEKFQNVQRVICLLLLLLSLGACSTESTYLRWVGDIPENPSLDDPEFQPCHGDQFIRQYFHMNQGALQYTGEKPVIVQFFQEHYQPVSTNESGFIRIRFIVNCEGKTGRFRLIGSDQNYQEFTFDPRITDQLLSLTQKMDGWRILPDPENPRDYYQYLIFKIDQGQIKEIMP